MVLQNFLFLHDCPSIDEEVVVELFGDSEEPELREMQIEIWSGVRKDFPVDLEEARKLLRDGEIETGKKLVHRIAGYTSSSGLSRVSRCLRAVERAEVPEDKIDQFLAETAVMAGENMTEMEARFPHLQDQSGMG
jgi:hypothetical protein